MHFADPVRRRRATGSTYWATEQRFPDLPVMMVTAYGDDERRRRATAEFLASRCT